MFWRCDYYFKFWIEIEDKFEAGSVQRFKLQFFKEQKKHVWLYWDGNDGTQDNVQQEM